MRVGKLEITTADLSRRMRALASEAQVPDPPSYRSCVERKRVIEQSLLAVLKEECAQEYHELKQQALISLIATDWIVGEAAERGITVSGRQWPVVAVKQAVSAIQARFAKSEAVITQAQVANYYKRHLSEFEHEEERDFQLSEGYKDRAEAVRGREAVERGVNLKKVSLAETLGRSGIGEAEDDRKALVRAIFTTRVHVLSPLYPFVRGYAFFEVTRIRSLIRKPLSQVQAAIERQLIATQRKQALARFIAAWRQKWLAKTSCSPGYVVRKCRQYSGPKTPENPNQLD